MCWGRVGYVVVDVVEGGRGRDDHGRVGSSGSTAILAIESGDRPRQTANEFEQERLLEHWQAGKEYAR